MCWSGRRHRQGGQAVLITEAMKMETEVQAAIAGKVTAIHVARATG